MVALLLGLTLGTSSCNWRMLCPVLVIMFGAAWTGEWWGTGLDQRWPPN